MNASGNMNSSLVASLVSLVILCLSCTQHGASQSQELSEASGNGPIFIKALSPKAWVKQKVGDQAFNRCEFTQGTVIQLSEQVMSINRFNGLDFVRFTSKNFSVSVKNDENTADEDVVATDGVAKEVDAGGDALASEEQDSTSETALTLENAAPTQDEAVAAQEPVVCNLSEGFIDSKEWSGSVLSPKKQVFPVSFNPSRSCLSPSPKETAFGFRRLGRLHAGCDMHARRGSNEPVKALDDGIVMDRYSFGIGLECAIEVKLANHMLARYGEISCQGGVKKGDTVRVGQIITRVGRISVRKDVDMLHLELYKGDVSGPLTQRWRRGYERRADLFNPTQFLRDLLRSSRE